MLAPHFVGLLLGVWAKVKLTCSGDVNLFHPRIDDGIVRVVGHVGPVVAIRFRTVWRRWLAELQGAVLLLDLRLCLQLLAVGLLGHHRAKMGQLVMLHQRL